MRDRKLHYLRGKLHSNCSLRAAHRYVFRRLFYRQTYLLVIDLTFRGLALGGGIKYTCAIRKGEGQHFSEVRDLPVACNDKTLNSFDSRVIYHPAICQIVGQSRAKSCGANLE
jgi:hypothetical protein